METRFELFTVLISRISRSIYKIKTGEMAEYNLKSSHVSCIYYLYKFHTLTARELCDLCGEDKANISRAIKHLENEGYIFCSSQISKRYQSPLALTQKGMKIGREIVEKIDRILLDTSKGLSDEERTKFYEYLSVISRNLEEICVKYN